MTAHNRLLSLLKKHSLSFGDFTLSSGKKSSYYIDCKRATYIPEAFELFGELAFQKIETEIIKIDSVGGLTMGADPLALSLVYKAYKKGHNLRAFSVRKNPKEYGKNRLIEANYKEGDNVIVLEDVLTTGKSTKKAISAVEKMNGTVLSVLCLVNRDEGGLDKLRDYKVEYLFHIDELLQKEKIAE